MSSTTQILTRDAYGVTYADPANPNYTVRFKTNRSVKGLNGVNVDNYLTEIIVNDKSSVSYGLGHAALDPLSVRVRVSGSIASMARLKTILTQVASELPSWSTENVFTGFEPATAPVNPDNV